MFLKMEAALILLACLSNSYRKLKYLNTQFSVI